MRRFVLTLLLLSGVASAAEEPLIRVDVSPATVTVGEAVNIRITLLVPTWFPTPPDYPDFELANAIMRLPPGASRPTSERIGGDTWSGVVRDYRVYPLTAASFAIEDERIRLVYANPGSEPIRRELEVPAINFDATVPSGAEALEPFIAGTRLDLALDVQGAEGTLEAGSAVVLRYTATLEGLPAVFLPDIAPAVDAPGLSAYAEEPRIDDGPPASRREQVTLVFSAGGQFDVPPVVLQYWNTSTSSVETARVDGVSFPVVGVPYDDGAAIVEPDRGGFRYVAAAIAALILLTVASARLKPRVQARRAAAAARRRHSEAYAFRRLTDALGTGSAADAYAALLTWLDRLAPGLDSQRFARQYGDSTLPGRLHDLAAMRFGVRPSRVDLAELAAPLNAARRRFLAAREYADQRDLAPLNPV